MSHPVVNYDGGYITCYPGSNQTDNGKLNLEFNMARLVTRVTSKNFCIVKPSYEITELISNTGKQQLQIGIGQCSINGMDLIMSSEIVIDAPESAGTYYLGFKLARGESNNVLGDQAYGVSITFKGLYLTYFDEKVENDADILYLAKVEWDGSKFTNIVEDEDKYGRIWAEDILCKIIDPKHPNVSRLTLQEWLYKVPDWYVSKEGDVIYGALDFYAGRTSTKSGITVASESNSRSYIKLAPGGSTASADMLLIESNNGTTKLALGESSLVSTANSFDILSPDTINVTSNGIANIWGKDIVNIKAGSQGSTPTLKVGNNGMELSDTTAPSLKYNVKFTNANTLQQIWGKAVWQYNYGDTSVSLASVDKDGNVVVSSLLINPNTDLQQSARVQKTLYLGESTNFGTDYTYLKSREWKIADADNSESIVIKPENLIITNKQLTSSSNTNSSYIQLKNNDATITTIIYDDAKITLKNPARTPRIIFSDGTSSKDAEIYKSIGGDLHLTSVSEIQMDKTIRVAGNVYATKVFNAVYNDLAEFMEKADEREIIDAGDVVYFDDNGKVTKWNENINPKAIAGVVSSDETYGFALGGEGLEDVQKVPIALCGRVYLKVGDMPVVVGDMIAIDDRGNLFITDSYNYNVLGIATTRAENEKVFIKVI